MPCNIKKVKITNSPSKEEDISIVNKIKNGDKNAFENIVKKYRVHIYNKVSKCVGFDNEYTEDIVQDVLVKIYTNIDKYNSTHYSFSAWIIAITKNHLIDQIRKDKLTPSYRNSLRIHTGDPSSATDNVGVISTDHLIGHSYDMGKEMDYSDKMTAVRKFINENFNETEKDVLKMFYIEQMKYREIIEKLGIGLSLVKITLFRAKTKIKKKFGNNFAYC